MSDLVERLRKPIDADRLYDWIVEKRKETNSDFPRLGFQNAMELIDEERHEAAARITELETALAEAEGRVIADVVAWLRDRMRQAPKDEFSQAACDVIFVLVAALETGEWKK